MGIEDLRTLGVVGAGQMGRGIAQVAAQAGFNVVLHDRDPRILEDATQAIARSVRRQAEKGSLASGEAGKVASRVQTVSDVGLLAGAGFVVEAVNESLPLKLEIFAALDSLCGPGTVLATNTSSLSITRIAAAARRPDRVIGMHFMNPVPVMPLVEIIAGQTTSAATVDRTRALAARLGKTAVLAQDFPGFISNRILMPMINEAIFALHEGVGSREDIDAVMTLGMRHPMGPLALADFIGLDTCLSILEVLHAGFGDPKYRPCPLLRRMVDAGRLGRKSGGGFYEYPAGEARWSK
jgi:3-hydroxybutyryl-CoA dehydrogenase